MYKFDAELDNFDETLDSYFETYQFFRKEMAILDTSKKKQKDLYDLSVKIISKLNLFLSSYQNNYRRWYKVTIENNEIEFINEEGRIEVKQELKSHLLGIGELQKYFYDYDDMVEGFNNINMFFKEQVNTNFTVNISKWERGENS